MTPHALKKLDRELTAFIADMTADMGRPERRAAMGHYITGLLLDGERKSVQPMAARLVDDRPGRCHAATIGRLRDLEPVVRFRVAAPACTQVQMRTART